MQVAVILQLPRDSRGDILHAEQRFVHRPFHPLLPKFLREGLVFPNVQSAAERNPLVCVERDATRFERLQHGEQFRPHCASVIDPAERVGVTYGCVWVSHGGIRGVTVEEEHGAPVRGIFCCILDGPPEGIFSMLALTNL